MDLRRLRAGEWIVAISGLALGISLFTPWYRAGELDVTAWQAFTVVDVLAFVLAVAALATVAIVADTRSDGPGLAAEGLLTPLTIVVCVVVVVRFANLPGAVENAGIGVSRAWGAYLGLAATLGVLAGVLAAIRDERLGSPEDVPEIETLPAPRASA